MSDALPRRAILIVNAMSRSGAGAFDEARAKLTEAGIELVEAHAITEPKQMGDAVAAAVAKAPMVILGGGDGSLSSNAGPFVGSDTVLALLPLGTANSFAKTLGIGTGLDEAVAVIAGGRRRRIDLGKIDGAYFVNSAAIGLSPMIADSVPHGLKRYLGMAGYLIWAGRCAFRFRPFRIAVTTDDGITHRCWTTEARIANGSYFGGVEMVEDQDVDSGEIVIQAVTGRRIAGLAWSWFSTLFNLSGRERTTTEWRGRKLLLETRPRQMLSIDGELAARTPVTVEVARGAIEVAAPREEEVRPTG